MKVYLVSKNPYTVVGIGTLSFVIVPAVQEPAFQKEYANRIVLCAGTLHHVVDLLIESVKTGQ